MGPFGVGVVSKSQPRKSRRFLRVLPARLRQGLKAARAPLAPLARLEVLAPLAPVALPVPLALLVPLALPVRMVRQALQAPPVQQVLTVAAERLVSLRL